MELTDETIEEASKLCGLTEPTAVAELGTHLRALLRQFIVKLGLEHMALNGPRKILPSEIDYFERVAESARCIRDFIGQLEPREIDQICAEEGLEQETSETNATDLRAIQRLVARSVPRDVVQGMAELFGNRSGRPLSGEMENPDHRTLLAQLHHIERFAAQKVNKTNEQLATMKNGGRPRHDALREFVQALAETFENRSGSRFTYDPFRPTREAEYEPITLGHRFVWSIIGPVIPRLDPLNGVTPTSVASECEQAVTALRSRRKHATAKSEKRTPQ